jgi:diacylglycerol kinase family enzyme
MRDIRVLYGNNVYRHPKVRHFRARKVVARSRQETRIEVDGEPMGKLPVEIQILPRCLTILVPRESPLISGG